MEAWWTRQERGVLTLAAAAAAAVLSLGLAWPARPSGLGSGVPRADWESALARSRQVDVQVAGVSELTRLPGIGPALARRIIAHRQLHGPCAHAQDLLQVSGIGPRTLANLRPYVTCGQ